MMTPSPPPLAAPPEVGALVLIRVGGQQRLHVAKVEAIVGSVLTVRKFLASVAGDDALPGAWARHPVKIPLSIAEPANPEDERVMAASLALGVREARRPAPKKKQKPKKTKRPAKGAKKTRSTPLPEST